MRCPKCDFDNPEDSRFCSRCGTQITRPEDIYFAPTKTLEKPIKELTRGSLLAGRYEVIEELGKGGMGSVYKVYDKEIKENIAIKLLDPVIAADERRIERFRNELKFARKITHRNVCRMHDLNKEEDTYYITMEYISGEDLGSLINRIGQFTVGKAVIIAKQACEGLAEAHHLGIVHRDLKPQNIMIDREGNTHILDFGIARAFKTRKITDTGMMIGTPDYMSPEQAEGGEVDGRTDLYSLGVILYEMLTGRVPFEGETPLSIALKHKSEEPRDPRDINPQIPAEVSHIILKCMEKDKEQRYQSADELLSALNNIMEGLPTTERVIPRRKSSVERISRIKWRNYILYAGAAAVLILLIVIGISLFKGGGEVIESIAVLPLKNLSGDPEQEYFTDGMTEALISNLTQLGALQRVISSTSVMQYKGARKPLPVIARELNVDAIIEGSVMRSGQRVRITAQLIEAKTDRNIWSKSYERDLSNVLAVQNEMARAIAKEIKIVVTPAEKALLTRSRPANPEAYQMYLKGRHFWNRRTEEDIKKSIEFFQQAINIDPTYALAYAGLADAYIILGGYSLSSPQETYPKAKSAALKALEIDDTLAEAYTSLAFVKYRYDWDWFGAEADYNWAIGLNPSYATAHQWYGLLLSDIGRFDEALLELKRARELDPLSLSINTGVGIIFYYSRQYDLAVEEYRKVLDIDANFGYAHFWLAMAYLQKSLFEEAIEAYQKAVILSGGNVSYKAALGYAYAAAGKRDEALKILNELVEQSSLRYVPKYEIALIYAGIGEEDKAFEFLERAYLDRASFLVRFKVDPRFDSLRSDPRFTALQEKIGLE